MSNRETNAEPSVDKRRRRLQRLGPVEFGDSQGTFARLRRQLRNPSIPTFLILCIIAVSIPLAIISPGFYSGAKDGIVRIRQDPVMHFLKASTPSWINPYLHRQINTMKTAAEPIEWRGVSFQHGPCFADNLEQLPDGKYSDGIADACHDLHAIQTEYAASCANTGSCDIPPEAVARLNTVQQNLIDVFSDAYSGYSETEEQFTP